MRKRALAATVAAAATAAAVVVVAAPWPAGLARLLAPDPSRLAAPDEAVYTDRDGAPLRHVPGASGARGEWSPLARLSPVLVRAVLAAEDSRFLSHRGVDPIAIVRAALDNVTCGRIVSGASTITQQLVRLVEPRPRTMPSKAIEAIRALALSRLMTKDQVLEQYLDRVPMPGNVRGMASAARLLLDRNAAELTLAEAALLASLPQSPGRLDPRRGARARGQLELRRRWVLSRMLALGWIDRAQHDQAMRSPPVLRRGRFPFGAPHLIDRLARAGADGAAAGPRGTVRTTLDGRVQRLVESTLASHRLRLARGGAEQAACVVLDTRSREVLAWVGSLAWGGPALGHNDGVVAARSAGSTLKPFVYAVALERDLTLATPLPDLRRTYASPRGDYDPRNFDGREYGPVLARAALGASLNAAAVEVARRTGPAAVADRLKALGLLDPARNAAALGLGIAIGNVEVSLIDLAGAYATLVSGGRHREPDVLLDGRRPDPGDRRLISADVAYLVTHALSDPSARLLTFGDLRCFEFDFPVALKTGTSTGYRDCWAVGCTPRYTVAVWAGNFSGAPTAGLAGPTGAAPVMHDVLVDLHRGRPPLAFVRPPGIVELPVCSDSGAAPQEHCPSRSTELFAARLPRPGPCTWHRPGQPLRTYLAPEFAAWLTDREIRGLIGRYRLDSGDGADRDPGGRASAGPPPHATLSAAGRRSGAIEITYPHPGDRFVVPRAAAQPPFIFVRAVPGRAVPFLRWFLDGSEVPSTPPPYRWRLPLARGHHTVLAASPDLAHTAAVAIRVE
jgi:penicillin-binding protein 1C